MVTPPASLLPRCFSVAWTDKQTSGGTGRTMPMALGTSLGSSGWVSASQGLGTREEGYVLWAPEP